jgi:hypothetical protein
MRLILYGQLIGAIKVEDHEIVGTSANSEAYKLHFD